MDLKEGTKVWPVAGGPGMSVKLKDTNGYYVCTWFDGKSFQEHAFTVGQLTTEPPKSGISSFGGNPKRNNHF